MEKNYLEIVNGDLKDMNITWEESEELAVAKTG